MTSSSEIRIAELTVAHLPEIVAVHLQSFPRSATTRLGPEAVRRYYEWQFLGPHQAHYLGAWVDVQLGGFCICGTFKGALGGFLARNKWFLAIQLSLHPWLLANLEVRSAVFRALARLWPRKLQRLPVGLQPKEPPSFGILAIAVGPQYRRLGLGARLMADAENLACRLGFASMSLTVSPDNSSAIKFYQKLGWMRDEKGGHWRGRLSKPVLGLARNSARAASDSM